jgi:hypothetical protein
VDEISDFEENFEHNNNNASTNKEIVEECGVEDSKM